MSLKYALIGCGRIAPNHIRAALDNGLTIVALCDTQSQKMEEVVSKFNLPESVRRYTAYKELLDNERPELVTIATESGKHARIALDCIDAGSNLIIEKPIALSLEDVDAIIEKAQVHGVKVSACHQNRFNKAVQKIREAIEGGRFGRIFHGTAHVRWSRGVDYYQQAAWRGTWEQDGGALMNQCIHTIDLLRWMMGDEIVEVMGMIDNLNHDYIETEDFGTALVKFANGSYGIIEGTTNIFSSDLEATLCIFGEKGFIKAGGKAVNTIEEWRFADGLDIPDEVKTHYQECASNVYGLGHNPLYADVIDAINNNRQPYVTAEDGRRALELVLAIYQSSLEGKRVKLPLEKCSTLDFRTVL